ncbi:MAG: response regulator [Deltaproteobacteria bacterium]|nr:response regulator [Deltaproteobacteria bacterium]
MGRHSVLLVDDEVNVLRACRRVLRGMDLDIDDITSPEQALRMLREKAYSALVSDQMMPGMTGTELLGKAKEISPDTVRIMLTGYADINAAIAAINNGAVFRYITKPWEPEDFREVIRQAITQYDLVLENRRLTELTARQNKELTDLNRSLEDKVKQRTAEVEQLNQDLMKSLLGAVDVLARLAEAHSKLIGNHSRRVGDVTKVLGRELGLEGRELVDLEIAATLHDIGKVGLSDSILYKPRHMLTDKELDEVRSHSERGQEILSSMANLENAALLVRHHHERPDGRGFPDRLSGDAIPLGAQIISVSDTFDHILNTRARPGEITPAEAVEKLRHMCPSALNEKVVETLGTCVESAESARDPGYEALQSKEVEVKFKDLDPGMVLSRDIKTRDGLLLLSRDTRLEQSHLRRLSSMLNTRPLLEGIYVYRGSLN